MFNSSLSVQIGWFQQLKPSLCSTPKQCDGYLGKSLFVMGEIGGNDYIYLLAANKTVAQTKSHVPTVVKAIAGGVEVPTDHNGCLLANLPWPFLALVDQCKCARACRG